MNIPKLNSTFTMHNNLSAPYSFVGKLVSISSAKGLVWLHLRKKKEIRLYICNVSDLIETDKNCYMINSSILQRKFTK